MNRIAQLFLAVVATAMWPATDEVATPGRHPVSWKGAATAPPGVYVARLRGAGVTLERRFVVAR
jgi:hypothetical protein